MRAIASKDVSCGQSLLTTHGKGPPRASIVKPCGRILGWGGGALYTQVALTLFPPQTILPQTARALSHRQYEPERRFVAWRQDIFIARVNNSYCSSGSKIRTASQILHFSLFSQPYSIEHGGICIFEVRSRRHAADLQCRGGHLPSSTADFVSPCISNRRAKSHYGHCRCFVWLTPLRQPYYHITISSSHVEMYHYFLCSLDTSFYFVEA